MPQALSVVMVVLVLLESAQAPNQDLPPSPAVKTDDAPLRDPFTLKLKLPGGSNYEERFESTPFVKDGATYIFAMQRPNRKESARHRFFRFLPVRAGSRGGRIRSAFWPFEICGSQNKAPNS
jgi:hypothetical protein